MPEGQNPITPKEVKNFSKTTPEGKQKRAETARDILRARRIERLEKNLNSLSQKTSEQDQIPTAQDPPEEITPSKQSWIGRALGGLLRKAKPAEQTPLPAIEHPQAETHNPELNQREKLQEELEKLKNDGEPQDPKKTLEGFYQKQQEGLIRKKIEEEKDKEARDVKKVISKYGIYFLHGIRPNWQPGGNTLLRENTNWQTKLNIALTLAPQLCCYSLSPEENLRRMFSRMGIIVNGGSIANASPGDRASVAYGVSQRTTFDSRKSTNIEEEIDSAVHHRGGDLKHNEFNISNPQVAGLYVCLDEIENTNDDLAPLKEILQTTKDIGLPVYAIKEGQVYKAKYNARRNKLICEEPVAPGQIAESDTGLAEDKINSISQELVDNCPFNPDKLALTIPEIFCVSNWNSGREFYIELNAPKNPDNFDGETVRYSRLKKEEKGDLKQGSKVRLVAQITTASAAYEYFIYGQDVYKRTTLFHFDEKSKTEKVTGIDKSIGSDTFKNQQVLYYGSDIKNNEAYLKHMESYIQKASEKLAAAEVQASNVLKMNHTQTVNKLLFHLYGFCEEAEKHNDLKTYQEAKSLIKRFLPEEKTQIFEQIISERIGEKGEFKYALNDFHRKI